MTEIRVKVEAKPGDTIVIELAPPPEPTPTPVPGPWSFEFGSVIVDLSHYQGLMTAEKLNQAKDSGVVGFIVKLVEGLGVDEQAMNTISILKQLGYPYGVYSEWRYDSDPIRQAMHYANQIAAIGGAGVLGAWAALEENYIRVEGKLQLVDPVPFKSTMQSDARKYFDWLQHLLVPIGVYTRPGWLNEFYPNSEWLGNYLVWMARYPKFKPSNIDLGVPLYKYWADHRSRVLLWQWDNGEMIYSEPVPGIGKADRNYWVYKEAL
jgi:GH25 family lysozyme M1 (1,4-beta-N-acetylmuramidase)